MPTDRAAHRPLDTRRIGSLDGLRGVAAVVVVFHHLALTFGPFSSLYLGPATHPAPFSAVWWLAYTPLQLLIAGPEAVLVFFVLSGLVLTLPARQRTDWFAYYPSRMVRLYLPAIASVLLATVWLLAVSGSTIPPSSRWANAARPAPPRPAQVINGFDLLTGDTVLNNPLWSLKWEVTFSLLLPVCILAAAAAGRRWKPAMALSVLALVIGNFIPIPSLAYLPVFVVGSLIAVRFEDIRDRVERMGSGARRTALGAGALIVSLLLLTVHWTVVGVVGSPSRITEGLKGFETLGAAGLVLLTAFWGPLRGVLSTAPFRWLGRISFSLYLVHVPIIASLDALFPAGLSALRVAVSLVAAVVVAVLFSRFVEQPSHRLAKRVGRLAAERAPVSRPAKDGASGEAPA